jgi:hypothetical protein
MHDYKFTSPSLEGLLSGGDITYEGVARPIEIFRVLDGPGAKGRKRDVSEAEYQVLGQYFQDLHSVFLKKLSSFALDTGYSPSEALKLQALLQEMTKVKRLLVREIKA